MRMICRCLAFSFLIGSLSIAAAPKASAEAIINQPGVIDNSYTLPTASDWTLNNSAIVGNTLTSPGLFNSCGSYGVLNQPAVMDTGGSCGVLTQPAVMDTCGSNMISPSIYSGYGSGFYGY